MGLFNKHSSLTMENQLLVSGFAVNTTKVIDSESDRIITVSEVYKTVNENNTVITEENDLGKLKGETIWIRFEFNNNIAYCGLDTPNINKNNINPMAIASYIEKLKIVYKYLYRLGIISNSDYENLNNFELGYKIPIEGKDLAKKRCYINEESMPDA